MVKKAVENERTVKLGPNKGAVEKQPWRRLPGAALQLLSSFSPSSLVSSAWKFNKAATGDGGGDDIDVSVWRLGVVSFYPIHSFILAAGKPAGGGVEGKGRSA